VDRDFQQLSKEQLIDLFIDLLRKPEVKIPVSIFKVRLSSLELIVKYMRELEYSNSKVSKILIRSPQNTWITYRNANNKHPEKLPVKESPDDLPLDIFSKELSILESIVKYYRSRGYNNKQISLILNRKLGTISTAYHRAMKKEGK